MNILIAEDDELTLTQQMKLFKGTKHLVEGVLNGETAINVTLRDKHDLVITDYDMPIKDGLAVIREVKKALPNTRVWLCSRHLTAELDTEARALGAEQIVFKPQLYNTLVREGIVPDDT